MNTERTLAVDGGATRTRAGLYDADGRCLAEASGPACNPIAYGEARCLSVLTELAADVGNADTVCAAISGANSVALRARLAEGMGAALGAIRAIVADDVWPLLAANANGGPAILVIAGTGSTVMGRDEDGRWARAAGRGPLLGDEGSGYAVAVAGLHAAAHAVDGVRGPSSLPDALVSAAGVENFAALPAWAAGVEKSDIANLAATILAAAEGNDAAARDAVEKQALLLARHIEAVARRLHLPEHAEVLLHGGLFEHSPYYREVFAHALESFQVSHPIRPVAYRGHQAVWRYTRTAETDSDELRAWWPSC